MNKKPRIFFLFLIVGVVLVEMSLYLFPYINPFPWVELGSFVLGICLLVGLLLILKRN